MRLMKLLITLIIASGICSQTTFAQAPHIAAAHGGGSDGIGGGSDGVATEAEAAAKSAAERSKQPWAGHTYTGHTYIEIRNLGQDLIGVGVFACTQEGSCSRLGAGYYRESVIEKNAPQNAGPVSDAITEILSTFKIREISIHELPVNNEAVVEDLNSFLLKLPASE